MIITSSFSPALLFQALQHGFFDFETFSVDEYEHYEVKTDTAVKYPSQRSSSFTPEDLLMSD